MCLLDSLYMYILEISASFNYIVLYEVAVIIRYFEICTNSLFLSCKFTPTNLLSIMSTGTCIL